MPFFQWFSLAHQECKLQRWCHAHEVGWDLVHHVYCPTLRWIDKVLGVSQDRHLVSLSEQIYLGFAVWYVLLNSAKLFVQSKCKTLPKAQRTWGLSSADQVICLGHIVTEFISVRSWQDKGLNHTAENRLLVQGKSHPTHAGCCALLQPPHFGLAILGENDK